MKIVIIEDESLAADHLERMILRYDSDIQILAKLVSVEETATWFKENPEPDLIFLDIHLEDNLSFAIFERTNIKTPIIFTTAYDEYAIRAFKLRSIDYLLKPIIQQELNQALQKYQEWQKSTSINISEIYESLKQRQVAYRERFSVQVGSKIKTVLVNEIAYFFSQESISFMILSDGSSYPIDSSLDQLMAQLNPKDFFRINRQYIISLNSIRNVHIYPKSRLKVDLNPRQDKEIFVSIDKVTKFKEWLDS
jgi:DNA-binding LytR/AlgR family response regulator